MTNIRTQTKPAYSEMPPRAWFFYGESKVGKTTLAAAFPKPLVLNPKVEDRTTEITCDVWDIPIGSIAELKAAVDFLKAGKHEYKFVVLDAATAYMDDIIAKTDESNPLRKVKKANDLLIPILTDFFALPIGKILTGHAKHDMIEEEVNNRKVQKHVIYPDLPQSFRTFITARVTAFGYCYPAQGGSKVRWTALETQKLSISAGNGLGLPDVTDLKYEPLYRAIVSAKPAGSGQAPDAGLNGDHKKWSQFVETHKITPTTIEAALGVARPSLWLEANKSKTIDDCINIVEKFVKAISP